MGQKQCYASGIKRQIFTTSFPASVLWTGRLVDYVFLNNCPVNTPQSIEKERIPR